MEMSRFDLNTLLFPFWKEKTKGFYELNFVVIECLRFYEKYSLNFCDSF